MAYETEFETEKSDVGLETHTWAGWHHHFAVGLLGEAFHLSLQQDWGKDAPDRAPAGVPGGAGVAAPDTDRMSCCAGWRMSRVATTGRAASHGSGAPPCAIKHQKFLFKPVVLILAPPALPAPTRYQVQSAAGCHQRCSRNHH